MKWKVFDENCQKDAQMLFLYYGTDVWFSGKYENDDEFGEGISSDDGHYVSPKFISHYLQVELPDVKNKL